MVVPLHLKSAQTRKRSFPRLSLRMPCKQSGLVRRIFYVFFRLMGRRCRIARRALPLKGIRG